MRQTLCTLALLLVGACGNGGDSDTLTTTDNTALKPDASQLDEARLDDEASIAALLTTEYGSADGSAFWRCTISDNVTTNIVGMRLNRDGTGYIAESSVKWEVINTNTAVFNLTDGYIEFDNISFVPLAGVANNRFSATEPAGTSVLCDWNGPGRHYHANAQNGSFQNDPGASLALLLQSLDASDTWQCEYPETQESPMISLTLLPENNARFNGTSATWFLNDRYDMLLQTEQDITVINQLYYPIGQSTEAGDEFFSGTIRGEAFHCRR